MAKNKYEQWLRPEKLEQLTNWAMKGCTDEELANNMGIASSTYYAWMLKPQCVEILEAIKRGRELCIDCIENMAFKVAMGLAEEETMVKVKNADGSERAEMRKRKLPPNGPMLMFLLKNKAGYRSEPETTVNVDVAPTFVYKRD